MAALLDVEMDCMEKEISDQSEHIDNTVRKVLAFTKQGKESATLALLNRYAARHAREYHRAVRHLREIQSERPRNKKLQNEPKPDPTPESAITSDGETGHRPLVSDRWEGISQNEPKPELTPEPSTTSRLATSHKPPATEFSPLATRHSSLQPARDHESELATSHQPLATEVSPLQPTEGNNATRIL
jgi:hypothetical protein